MKAVLSLSFKQTNENSCTSLSCPSILVTVNQWQKMVEEKLGPLFNSTEVLSEDEAAKMGRKDPEQEVEKFVTANTQELGKDKWLCPLSGKKFKVGPHVCSKVVVVVMQATSVSLRSHGNNINNMLSSRAPSLCASTS